MIIFLTKKLRMKKKANVLVGSFLLKGQSTVLSDKVHYVLCIGALGMRVNIIYIPGRPARTATSARGSTV